MTFEEVTAKLQAHHPEVMLSKMFGMPCLKLDTGKVLAGDWKGDMVFKLVVEADRRKALKIAGAELFDPGMGKPMKEWVVVPAAKSDQWPELTYLAYQGMVA